VLVFFANTLLAALGTFALSLAGITHNSLLSMESMNFLKKHRNILLYGVIGVSAMVVDVVFFIVFFNVFEASPIISTFISVTIATVYAFTLNAVFNFKTRDFLRSRFFSYAVVSMVGMLASAVIIEVFLLLDVDPNIAKVLSLPPIVILQYLFNKTVTFNKR
jgi:putative flippase GtrA